MASMEKTSFPKPPVQIPGTLPAIGFPQFANLPAELRFQIYQEAQPVERVLRLDLGVDTIPTLLLVCQESRAETQKQFTTHRGEIYSDGTALGTVATPSVRFQIWINKNGRDILHLTPLYRQSFPSTQSVPPDHKDPSSFAITNFKAMDELCCVRPEGGRPFENFNRVMVEYGINEHLYLFPYEVYQEIDMWSELYAGLVVRNSPVELYAARLGITLSELRVVGRPREFDAARVGLENLEERARCKMPAKQTHCEELKCPSIHGFHYEQGKISRRKLLSPHEDILMRSIAMSFEMTMESYHSVAARKEPGHELVQPESSDVVLLG